MYFASQGIRGISGDILDAARTLGVGERTVASRVILPLAAPAIATGASLAFAIILGLTSAVGALAPMLPPFRLGLGGPLGSGRQWWSFIALDDLLYLIHHVLTNDSVRGAVNATCMANGRSPVRRRFNWAMAASAKTATTATAPVTTNAQGEASTTWTIGTVAGVSTTVAPLVTTVYSVERIAALQVRARRVMRDLRISNVFMRHGDGFEGWPPYAPYDGIIVAAAGPGSVMPDWKRPSRMGTATFTNPPAFTAGLSNITVSTLAVGALTVTNVPTLTAGLSNLTALGTTALATMEIQKEYKAKDAKALRKAALRAAKAIAGGPRRQPSSCSGPAAASRSGPAGGSAAGTPSS